MIANESNENVSVGRRLRQARELRGASPQEAAAALHLPLSVIEALEAERFEQLGAAVYARGHLRSYLRWLALPEVIAETAIRGIAANPPDLRSATHVPRIRYLADRYAVRAVYVLLTLSIIVPALWVATEHSPLKAPAGEARSLDRPPAATPELDRDLALPLPPPEGRQADAADLPSSGTTKREQTVVASLAPFYTAEPRSEPAPAVADAPAAAVAPVADGWLFRFSGESWVEVVDQQGARLAYGLIPAGSERRFPAGSLARVSLGNATAVSVERGGGKVDIEPFRRANVARFAVSSSGELRALGEQP